jgi:conjugative transfer pilus assembly protein TraH
MRIKLLSLFCGAALGLSFSAAADVNGDMNNFFNKLGFASNTSQPQVWQGQAAGYASGGSLYARTQVKTIQLVSMTLPDINAGCGGIDAYLGSFSFINSEQLQRFANKLCPTPRATFLTSPCRPRFRRSKPQRTSFRRWPRHEQHEPQLLPGRSGHCGRSVSTDPGGAAKGLPGHCR